MPWVIYASLSALSLATTDALSKKALSKSGSIFIAWVRLTFALPFLLTILPFIDIPRLDTTFWITIIVILPLEISSTLLYLRAIEISPLSMTIPFLALTPVFSILTSFVILNELPSLKGSAGILLIAAGAYLLNIHTTKEGMLEPLKKILQEKGSMLMILVAFIYSITSNLGKIAINHSGPCFFAVFYVLYIGLALLPFVIMKHRREVIPLLRINFPLFTLIGLSFAIMVITHNLAIRLIEVPYMISIKRMSLVFSVIYGAVFFNEANIKERLLGVTVMVIGAVIITLSAS